MVQKREFKGKLWMSGQKMAQNRLIYLEDGETEKKEVSFFARRIH